MEEVCWYEYLVITTEIYVGDRIGNMTNLDNSSPLTQQYFSSIYAAAIVFISYLEPLILGLENKQRLRRLASSAKSKPWQRKLPQSKVQLKAFYNASALRAEEQTV
jgi:hypothetical protein